MTATPTLLNYGDTVRIVNSYGGQNKGGYLGIGPAASKITGALDLIGTFATTDNHDDVTQWIIQPSADSPKNPGESVLSGDKINLVNSKDNGYLALFNSIPPGNTGYPVATSSASNNPTITIAWYILIKTPNQGNDQALSDQTELYLVATFGPLASVLDTNGVGVKPFDKYSVTGARLVTRDGGSGAWTMTKV